jgi:hypothetical protein
MTSANLHPCARSSRLGAGDFSSAEWPHPACRKRAAREQRGREGDESRVIYSGGPLKSDAPRVSSMRRVQPERLDTL